MDNFLKYLSSLTINIEPNNLMFLVRAGLQNRQTVFDINKKGKCFMFVIIFWNTKKRERDKGATLVVLLDITKQQCCDLHPAKGLQGLRELPQTRSSQHLCSSQAWMEAVNVIWVKDLLRAIHKICVIGTDSNIAKSTVAAGFKGDGTFAKCHKPVFGANPATQNQPSSAGTVPICAINLVLKRRQRSEPICTFAFITSRTQGALSTKQCLGTTTDALNNERC